MKAALNLLWSIFSATLISFLLSLLLPLRRYFSSSRFSSNLSKSSVSLYEGIVWHERRRPVHHSFRYSVRYALFDLDHAPHAPPDHLSADEARRLAGTRGSILLLTIPASVGYEQNPLSLYYCYDGEGSTHHLNKCIAEVTNTPWGERVTFVFNPESDLVAKPLHVSPFMDMLGNWSIRANAPGDDLYVTILVQHPKLGNYFTASLKAKKVSSTYVSDHALFFWLMPHKVAIWIYWHAVKLWWKNVSFLDHPRYTSPAYKKEAVLRDQKLQCYQVNGLRKDKDEAIEEHELEYMDGKSFGGRNFTWREASCSWS